jgi:hypothetical protein
MKNLFTLLIIIVFIGFAIIKGVSLQQQQPHAVQYGKTHDEVPYIGRLQVLNGCGTEGIAHLMADYLRKNHFDVKDIGNADNWNFPETLVISRINDTTIAAQVAQVLNTNNMVLIKNQEKLYDVTVIVGPDYRERLNEKK